VPSTTVGLMELDRDFSEFIACCVARDVRFLIVGGYALAAHGHPRFTKDLDVWIWRPVPFIDIDHLVLNKRASGRLQDLADAEALTSRPYGSGRLSGPARKFCWC
jgi:hypothetical protein